MSPILAVARREFRQLVRDRVILLIAFTIPLLLITLYGTVLTANIANLGLAIEDFDQTPTSRRYIDALVGTNKFVVVPISAPIDKLIEKNTARAALRIPPQFETDLKAGRVPEVQLLIDGTESNSATLMRGVNAMVARTFQATPSPVQASKPSIGLRVQHWYNPGLKDELFFGSGALGLVLILFPALLGALSASRDKEFGTITQAYCAKVKATQWVIGKSIPYVMLGTVQLLLCFSFGFVIFRYPVPDHAVTFFAAGILYVVTAVLYGMMIGNATGVQSAAVQAVQFGAFIFSLMFSGFFMPIQNIPSGIRWVSNLIPARHFIEITRDMVLRGGDWNTSAKPLLSLAALALLFLLASVIRNRRMQFDA